jgi:hypothetical protein
MIMPTSTNPLLQKKKGAVKRLSETLDFWVNATRYNALEIHAKGYEFAIKTRLIHSYARLSIKKHYKEWDTENWGEPINSWDMMATYIGFSLVFLHSLIKLGNTISPEEEQGIFHLWKYVGYLLESRSSFSPMTKSRLRNIFIYGLPFSRHRIKILYSSPTLYWMNLWKILF